LLELADKIKSWFIRNDATGIQGSMEIEEIWQAGVVLMQKCWFVLMIGSITEEIIDGVSYGAENTA